MTDRGFDLRGHGLHLTAAHPDDAADLWPLTDAELWRGMTTPWPESVEAYAVHIERQRATPGTSAFVVRDAETGRPCGSTSFYEYVPAQLEALPRG